MTQIDKISNGIQKLDGQHPQVFFEFQSYLLKCINYQWQFISFFVKPQNLFNFHHHFFLMLKFLSKLNMIPGYSHFPNRLPHFLQGIIYAWIMDSQIQLTHILHLRHKHWTRTMPQVSWKFTVTIKGIYLTFTVSSPYSKFWLFWRLSYSRSSIAIVEVKAASTDTPNWPAQVSNRYARLSSVNN